MKDNIAKKRKRYGTMLEKMKRKTTYIILICILIAEWAVFYCGGREFLITANSASLDIIAQILLVLPLEFILYLVRGEEKLPKIIKKDCNIVFWYMIVYCAVRILIRLSM